jgi:hypothetical protein
VTYSLNLEFEAGSTEADDIKGFLEWLNERHKKATIALEAQQAAMLSVVLDELWEMMGA